ncbi:hypothetical protein [Cellulophaga baltica]|uniref:hypothetical protein n=1 Tax=Cellulophaga baltica TaxID=76594 RepID=UPI00040418AF|nr:hypothetical protein [Cellulophaga baltica]
MSNYTNIIPNEKFNFAIPNPDYNNVNDFLKESKSQDNDLIEGIIKSNLLTGKNIIVFKIKDFRIGVLGRGFSGLSMADSNLISLSLFDYDLNNKVDTIKVFNMHPAKGHGYGTISFSTNSKSKSMIIFFIDSDHDKWNEDFNKSESYISEIQKFLNVDNVKTDTGYNC